MMISTHSFEVKVRPEILQARHRYGMYFGMALGLTFALATWGIDAILLNNVHGLRPWIKFAAGAIPCMIIGGFTGWLSAKLDKSVLSFVLWLLAASFFAWMTVSVPIQIAPRLLNIVEPETQGLLHYTYYENFAFRISVAYIWIAIFVSMIGLLQIPLSESAVFSTSGGGKIFPMLVCAVVMWICGTIVDSSLVNEPLRSATTALDATLQFSLEHQGQEIDRATSLEMHLGSLRTIQSVISPQYKLMVSGYDEYFGEVQVLARFEKSWVECTVVYNQPSTCHEVGEAP